MVHLEVLSSQAPPELEALRQRVAAELERLAPGQVRFGRHDRMLYSTDASNYQVEPVGVVVPNSVEALQKVVLYCAENNLAMLPRGGGTSLPGQCTNRAIVVDHSAFCRRLLEVDFEKRICHVEPGITVDELNRQLESEWRVRIADKQLNGPQCGPCTLFFAPDPATSAQATIGGCIGNNAAGSHSIRYGRTSENVAELDVLLTSGQRMWLGAGAGRRDGNALRLAQQVTEVVRRCADEIRARFPKTSRRNAGYALDSVVAQLDRGVTPEDLDLTTLLCGSAGTLAVVLGAKLKLHPLPRSKGLAIVSFSSVDDAIHAVPTVLTTGPAAIELIDDDILRAAGGNAECRRFMHVLPKLNGADPAAVLYVEYQETGSGEEVEARFEKLRAAVPGATLAAYTDKKSLADAWALRKAGEPLLHGLSAHRKPITLIEDNAIPVENLARFVAGIRKIVAENGTHASYYAHASVGVLHIRPMLDLHDPADRQRMQAIAVAAADLARECGGVMSGEHGDGRVRGPLLERFYGPRIMQAFREVKAVFDPKGLLNPGLVIDLGPVETMTQNLRVAPGNQPIRWPGVETYFDYSDQEGFVGAVEMCNGAGVCRRTAGGVMCPSYRATRDERHSTRGRGNALRLAISGQFHLSTSPPLSSFSPWSDADTIETLSLCLSCKACKTECPSNVDMARLKAEFTAQRYKATGHVPLQAKVFGHIRRLNQLGSIAPGLSNWISSLPPVRRVMNRILNLAPQRSLPQFAPSLYRWFARHSQAANESRPRVVLYADCFTTYNEPGIGQAAILLLESLGYTVELPRVGCCGRSMISMGLLEDAIRTADRTLSELQRYIEDDGVRAILVCEPSCLATMKDEWIQLKLNTDKCLRRRCAERALMVEDFVDRFWDEHPNRPVLAGLPIRPVVLHGHCHQKALGTDESSAALLRRLTGGANLTVLPSGCCGMAGSFGYAADRYDVSMKIGDLGLFDFVRQAAPDAIITAPGTSCRHQIKDGTGRAAVHPVEAAWNLLCSSKCR